MRKNQKTLNFSMETLTMQKQLALLLSLACLSILFLGCCSLVPPVLKANSTSATVTSLNVTVIDTRETPLEGALITLIGNSTTYSGVTNANGKYRFDDLKKGNYTLIIKKDEYSDFTATETFDLPGTYKMSPILKPLFYIYPFPSNTSADYVMILSFNGTIHSGRINITLPYPYNSYYNISPAPGGAKSRITISYIGENRILSWVLDDRADEDVPAYFSIIQKGTSQMKIYQDTGMSISDAAAAQPNYLGVGYHMFFGKRMIDPYDYSIRAVAENVKAQTNSNNTWTVARALFIWLKNNTRANMNATSFMTASEVLKVREGYCQELSSLYISLLRSVGIPSRQVSGYWLTGTSGQGGRGHDWVEFYDAEWVPVEVTSSDDLQFNLDYYFGVQQTDHARDFVDDATNNSNYFNIFRHLYLEYDDAGNVLPQSFYMGKGPLPAMEGHFNYELNGFDPMYLKVYENGTRVFVTSSN